MPPLLKIKYSGPPHPHPRPLTVDGLVERGPAGLTPPDRRNLILIFFFFFDCPLFA